MKWIGQHIWDFISRFRSDVYLEDLSTTTESNVLVVDSDGKVSKNTTTIGGDITGVTLSSDSGGASDSTGNVDLTIAGGNAIGTTATGSTVTINHDDTSSQASVNNGGRTFIQDITLDNYGHVTGLASVLDSDTYTGTVTSVGTTGTVNGVTLTGTVTSSGNLTLGGTLAINNSDWSGTDLSVANGGTGVSTLTDNAILSGTGTSAVTAEDTSIASGVISRSGTMEIEGTTVTLDSAGAITFEAHGSATIEVGKTSGTLEVVDLVKYLLPSDFMVNDAAFARGYQYAAFDGNPYGGAWQDPGIQAWAWYQIPKGFKITHMYARGNSTHASTDCSIYQLDPTDGTRGSGLAGGAWGTNRSLSTAITSADDAVALVTITPQSTLNVIFSVTLTLAEV